MAVAEHEAVEYVVPAALQVGMYVHLDLSWMQHPFPSASFKIKDASQIDRIQALNLARVRIDPLLSEAAGAADAGSAPFGSHQATRPEAPRPMAPTPAPPPRAADHRAVRSACERELSAAAQQVRAISRSVHIDAEAAGEAARTLVDDLATSLLADADMAIHLMAEKVGNDTVYHHALNVCLLSMLLARQMKAPPQAVRAIGLGALLHDIGKFDIPERVWRKTEPLTRAEQAWVQQHAPAGVTLAREMKMPPEVLTVIAQHHERADGQGYPRKLKGDQISLLARIVIIANTYDNLCNPPHHSLALTPHEALSMMFGQRSKEFDEAALATFVRCLGIYPPGTLVGLSDGAMGVVIAVNSSRSLKPTVMLYDPAVPRGDAVMLDLEEHPTLSIVKTFRPEDLGVEAYDYLSPRARTTYFFHAERSRAEG